MSSVVTFGRYLPGDTAVHQLDARVKVLGALSCTFALFASHTWVALVAVGVATALVYAAAKIPATVAWRGVKPLLWILAFTVLANTVTFHAGAVEGAVSLIGAFGYKPTGFVSGLYYSLRIALLVLACSVITFTTSNIELADALVALMGPLRRFRVPVDDAAMMVSIALRFIPLTAQEAQQIVASQRVRGVRFNQGSLLARARAWTVVIVPLFVALFRRADELARAMETRCYTGEGRTNMRTRPMGRRDWAVLGVMVGLCVAVGILL